jgi:hypothetical protein
MHQVPRRKDDVRLRTPYVAVLLDVGSSREEHHLRELHEW